MLLSVSNAYERKRNELITNYKTSMVSETSMNNSDELDCFVHHLMNQRLPELEISQTQKNSTLTITIKGQLDFFTSDKLTAYIEMAKQRWKEFKELHINLLDLRFFDTSGIRVLLSLVVEADHHHLLRKILNINPNAFELIKMMGIVNYLDHMNCEVIK